MKIDFIELVNKVGQLLKTQNLLLATAESCTGGQVAHVITSIAGISSWFERGFVTYSNNAKIEMLGVSPATLACYGAVSAEVAREMAEGALRHSHAQLSLAITGIAGPDGGTAQKPVGTVWFAWSGIGLLTQTECQCFKGDRINICTQAAAFALQGLISRL